MDTHINFCVLHMFNVYFIKDIGGIPQRASYFHSFDLSRVSAGYDSCAQPSNLWKHGNNQQAATKTDVARNTKS